MSKTFIASSVVNVKKLRRTLCLFCTLFLNVKELPRTLCPKSLFTQILMTDRDGKLYLALALYVFRSFRLIIVNEKGIPRGNT